MKSQKPVDFDDKESVDRLRFLGEVVLLNIKRENERTIAGTFKNPYSGHAYENTHKGVIPADSVSLRPFHFLIYLSQSGKIYISAQYLGQYGGYTSLQITIRSMLPKYNDIESRTYRAESMDLHEAEAREVRVTLARKPSSITQGNVFQQSSVITFKKSNKDDGFSEEVSKKIFPFFGKPISDVKKVVAAVLNQNDLIDVNDEDIKDCNVVAKINGKMKTIYMIDDGNFATRFPINVALNKDGHPDFDPTKKAMIELLTKEIISKSEDA